MTGTPPDALDWHPWYRDKTWLLEWLESADDSDRVVPATQRVRYHDFDVDAPIGSTARDHPRLSKRLAYGGAPYVGEPFIYLWKVATDQYGRSIAGESRIVYPAGRPCDHVNEQGEITEEGGCDRCEA